MELHGLSFSKFCIRCDLGSKNLDAITKIKNI